MSYVLSHVVVAAQPPPSKAPICLVVPAPTTTSNQLFAPIIAGYKAQLNAPPCTYSLDDADPHKLDAFLKDNRPSAVLTLGRVATEAVEQSPARAPQLIGGLDLSPQTRPSARGISLTPAPEPIFDRLKALVPTLQRILTVYDPTHDAWILPRLQQAARDRHLELIAEPAQSLTEVGNHYGEFVRTAHSKTDAIWLAGKPNFIDDPHLLEYVVSEAWDRHLVVVSNLLRHAQAGTLFASYPDLEALGHRLANAAIALRDHPEGSTSVEMLTDVKFAINIRILRHLEIPETPELLNRFNEKFDPKGVLE